MIKRTVTALLTICMGIAIGVLLAVAGHSGTAVAATPDLQPSSHDASATPGSSLDRSASRSIEISPGDEQIAATGPGYFIKEYRGRVSVIEDGQQEPEMIFDIQTKMLPELDRQQLAEGIYVATYEELIRLVEDYIS